MDTRTATRTTASTAALVALKAGAAVKSRLGSLPDPLRSELAWAMSLDTIRVLAAGTDLVLVVSDRPGLAAALASAAVPATVLADGQPGMNQALARGDEWLRQQGFSAVLACVGDLPALNLTALTHVLVAGSNPGRHFVADRSGVGTTMLLARQAPLDPRFQGESARAHAASGAAALAAIEPSARCDVDTVEDLAVAVELGLGPSTRAVIAAAPELRHLRH